MKKYVWFRGLAVFLAVAAVGLGFCLMMGCEGGGKSGATGSTLKGHVVSFSGVSMTYVAPAPRGLLNRIAIAISDLLVAPACADDHQPITVTLQGTDYTATTTDGEFEISGIPAGSYILVFTMGTETGTYPIDIPDKATVELEGITISSGAVTIQKVSIEADDDEDDDDQGEDANDDDDESEHEGTTNHVGKVEDDSRDD